MDMNGFLKGAEMRRAILGEAGEFRGVGAAGSAPERLFTASDKRLSRRDSGGALLLVLLASSLLLALALGLWSLVSRNVSAGATDVSAFRRKMALETAVAILVSDVRSEMKAGSHPTGGETEVLYPTSPAAAVPWRAQYLPASLCKQSSAASPFYDPTQTFAGTLVYPNADKFPVRARATALPSDSPSANGRVVDASRWMAPRLLPSMEALRQGGLKWSPPCWVLLQQDGATTGEWSALSRRDPRHPERPQTVFARYAYQVFEVGGLLDMNVCGYLPQDFSAASAGRKGGAVFADLREVGFTAGAVERLVKWREPGAPFMAGGPPFWDGRLNFWLSGGFGVAGLRNLRTDAHRTSAGDRVRSFKSRGELIGFVRSLACEEGGRSHQMLDALQHVTHFSRALDQPSFRPGFWDADEKRWRMPRIIPPAGGWSDGLYPSESCATLPAKDVRRSMQLPYEMALGNYRGGNDAWGTFLQRGGDGDRWLQDVINPGFLEVRVGTPFLRQDGRMAREGEPLVQRRFPLSRLRWVTFRGPSAQLPEADPLYCADGTPRAIRESFGLEWCSGSGAPQASGDGPDVPAGDAGGAFWKYDHSRPRGRVPSGGIGRLEDVAADGREPDFFELLKAGISVGSLGKAAAKNHSGMEGWAHDSASYYQLRDKDPNFQILEIGANIIDQYDSDSFPTVVKIGLNGTGESGVPLWAPIFAARGIENLPYLYRLHWSAVENALDPPLRQCSEVREITDRINEYTGEQFACGTTSLIAFPELWNPHAPPTRKRDGELKLRVVAVGEDPGGAGCGTLPAAQFPLLSTRWKSLLLSGPANERRAHFAAWPCGTFAFALPSQGKSLKTFFHDRRFGTSYEFFGTSASADDYHSARLATNGPAEPASYLFWSEMPAGSVDRKYAVEGYAYWRLGTGSFSPDPTANQEAPESGRGWSFSVYRGSSPVSDAPRWFVPADGRVRGRKVLEPGPRLHQSDPVAPVVEIRNSELEFDLSFVRQDLFREPTALCRKGYPLGTGLRFGEANFFHAAPYGGSLLGTDGADWIGFSLGEVPSQFIAAQRLVSAPRTTVNGTPERSGPRGELSETGTYWRYFQVPVNLVAQRTWAFLTLRLQYQDPGSGRWTTYDERFMSMDGRMEPDCPPYQGHWNAVQVEGKTPELGWCRPMLTCCDPRTARFGMFQRYAYPWASAGSVGRKNAPDVSLGFQGMGDTDRPSFSGNLRAVAALGFGPAQTGLSWVRFKAAMDQTKAAVDAQYLTHQEWWANRSLVQAPSLNANDYGWISRYGNPPFVSDAGLAGVRGFPHFWEDYSHDAGSQESTETGLWQYGADTFRQGWLSENVAPHPGSPDRQAVADADDVIRRALGAYASAGGYDAAETGLPLSQSSAGSGASRPVILDRPFRSVAELGYVFRAAPWKHIDFSTPETGDAALLDLFCIGETPAADRPLVLGRVNLNTQQEPVLRALLAGSLKHEAGLDGNRDLMTSEEVSRTAKALLSRTSGEGLGRGPLVNVGDLAGRIIGRDLAGVSGGMFPNAYTTVLNVAGSENGALYTSIAPSTVTQPKRNPELPEGGPVAWTFSGFSADLDHVFGHSADGKLRRVRESALRALADGGQTRVWNLMFDVILQTGAYGSKAKGPADFHVEGETRAWVCVAMDRLTGEVLDMQWEIVHE